MPRLKQHPESQSEGMLEPVSLLCYAAYSQDQSA